jgi:thioester reductase-like protein|eukprot:COSAG06_NODE_17102_length_960_cov_126.279907_1_plen_57_part_00
MMEFELDVVVLFSKFQDGYGLSKLVGERMVETAVERGLSANIVRLGFIGGSSLTGE